MTNGRGQFSESQSVTSIEIKRYFTGKFSS